MAFWQHTGRLARAVMAPVFAAALMAGAATAQGYVVIERTNVQTAPAHFTPAVTVRANGPAQIVRLGERGLNRANYWDDAALTAWASATFNARATIYTVPDIPEFND